MSAEIVTFDVDSPVGTLRCAATQHGLALVVFPGSPFDEPLARLAAGAPVRRGRSAAARELTDWCAGRRRDFDCAVDLSAATPFARDVLEELRAVPFGALITYGELAARVGRPGGARAVGRVMGANPVPVVIP